MPDEPLPSLDELRRQRELVAQHLAWLDRQIADRGDGGDGGRPPGAVPSTGPTANVPGGHISPAEPEAILERYRVEPTNVTRAVRRGCLLYFIAGFLVLGGLVWLLYLGLR